VRDLINRRVTRVCRGAFSVLVAVVLCDCAAAPDRAPEPRPISAAITAVDAQALTDAPSPPSTAPATQLTTAATAPAATTQSDDPIARIRDEGLNRSQVMQTLSYLTDVIGPRLTGSPNLRRANEWTQHRLTEWGLVNAHLEAWGPFGRGWSLERFSAQVIEPQHISLIAAPRAWSPGFDQPIEADVIFIDAKTEPQLLQYTGKLKGAIVLTAPPRDVQARWDPLAVRLTDGDLLKLANAGTDTLSPPGISRATTPAERQALLPTGLAGRISAGAPTTAPATTRTTTGPATNAAARQAFQFRVALDRFLNEEHPALIVSPSVQGDGGTIFVAQATPASQPTTQPAVSPTGRPPQARPWSKETPATIPQITVAVEDYNRMVRMIRQGEHLRMAVDLRVKFHDEDPMAYNTIAEIPGTDLADQIVMLGAHMDSWHTGTGATDNGAGCAATMEAVRILRALNLHPRRTIRIGLWSGEEEGIFGSRAYVAKHFGEYRAPATQPAAQATVQSAPRTRRARSNAATTSRPATQPRTLARGPEYDRLSAYFNLDVGTGKIRGVYLQGNESCRTILRRWLTPLADLGADTLTSAGMSGTDHLSFDEIGLPAFPFIQDPVEYWSRTHHSNQDVYDHVQPDDLKQAAVVIATLVYDAAMADDMLPRKPVKETK
jgi:carboxypeptidase Q